MITILHLRDTDRVCGPGKTIIETACAADHRQFKHKVGLFLLNHEKTNLYRDAAAQRGLEVLPIRSGHQFDPRVIATIAGVVRDHQVDIIHSHEYKSDLLAWAVTRLYRVPVMTTVHGWIRNRVKSKMYIRAAQSVLRSFDRVVAVSNETKAAVLACGVPEHKIAVIHNGIVTENYRPDEHRPGYLRHRFGLPEDALLVGYVGRLSAEKAQADLLVAARQIVRTYTNTWFVLVGDGPDEASLRQQAISLGLGDRVLFTGYLPDVRPVFRDLDVLALTSHTEGFPNVVLESLCMETPVLATDVGGVREIVEDGVTGVLVPPRAPERIAEGLAKLLAHPTWARSLALNGKRVVHEQFTFGVRVAKEEQVCREILESWKH